MKSDSETIRAIIVDDEELARHVVREMLAAHPEVEIVGECANGFEAVKMVSELKPDLLLLDVQMPKLDGFEVLELVGRDVATIFVTAYDQYALKAFEVHAVDYLLKPIRLGRLLDSLARARGAIPVQAEVLRTLSPEPRKNLSIHERGKIILVPIEEVLYLRAELKYVTVRTANHEYLLEESLSALEKEFAPRFVRIHRNCLVSKEDIEGFEKGGAEGESGWMVKLKGLDERLAISRRQQHIIRELG